MMKIQFADKYGEINLDQTRITIGRDPSNDVMIDDGGVSGFHAEIQTQEGCSYLVDLGSSNGTFIDGKRLNGRQQIRAWEKIRFDKVEAEVIDPSGRRPTMVNTAITDEMIAKAANNADSNKTTVRQAVGDWALIGTSGVSAGRTISLSGKMVIGREDECDITLESNEVSRKHAELEVSAVGLKVRDLGSANGVFVNGGKVSESILKNGDEVRFDQIAFKVQELGDDPNKTRVRPAVGGSAAATAVRSAVDKPANATQIIATSRPQLVGLSEGHKGNEYLVSGHKATVGRESDNDFIIDDSTVSAHHARIYSESGAWKVEDKGSSNGTFVNGVRVSGSTALNNGDKIRFGKVELSYSDGSSSAGKTKIMSAVPDGSKTKTSVHAVKGKGVPAWLYGLGGFAIAGIGLAYFLFGDQLGVASVKQPVGPLQASKAWSQTLPDSRQNPSTPMLADINGDKFLDVIAVDVGGHLLVLDGQEGKRVIDVDIADRMIAPPVAGDLSGDGVDDIVVSTNSGEVSVINGKGKALWKSPSDLGAGAIVNRPVLADVNGDGVKDVIVPTERKGLVALDGARGWELWNSADVTKGKVITSPVVKDINNDGVLDFVSLTDQGSLTAVTAKDGKVWKLWGAKASAPVLYASPAYIKAGEQGLIVVATNGGGITAIRADSGRMAWRSDVKKKFFASPVSGDANGDGVADVVAVAMNGDIHVLDALTGDEIWSAATGAGVQATPALFDFNDDRLPDIAILDVQGNLNILDMSRGRSILKVGIPGADGYIASPVLGDLTNDGMLELVAASQNGGMTALSINRVVRKGHAPWPAFLGNDSHGI